MEVALTVKKSDGWILLGVPFMVLPAGQLSSLDFGSYEEMKKQRWTCIDILKCLAALAVVEIHKPLKVQSGAELLILCRFAVPVFFMITGFFYPETVAHRRELKQIGKILHHYHWSKSVLPDMGNPSGS